MQAPVLANRATIVTINENRPGPVQPKILYERYSSAIAVSDSDETVDAVLVAGVGWQIRSYTDHPEALYEDGRGTDGIYRKSEGQAATGVSEFDTQRKNTGTGITYDANTNATGSPMMQKRRTASASWDDKISGDMTTWPVPDQSLDRTDVDRLFITTENHDPRDILYLRFFVPGSAHMAFSTIGGIVFVGPAGKDQDGEGIGIYYLKLMGHGVGILYEAHVDSLTSAAATWIKRYRWQWSSADAVSGRWHMIRIQSNVRWNPLLGKFQGGRILFFSEGNIAATGSEKGQSGGTSGWMASIGANLLLGQDRQSDLSIGGRRIPYNGRYDAPCSDDAQIYQTTIRLDFRRDLRPIFQIARNKFPTSATIKDDVFGLPFFATADESFTVEWYADTPTGTTVDVKMYDAETDVELTGGTTVFTDFLGGQKTYDAPDRKRKFYFKYVFTGDGDRTPTLTLVRLFRNTVLVTPDLTEIEAPMRTHELAQIDLTGITIQPATQDPSSESAVIELFDYTNDLETLRTQSRQPIRIETEYDAIGSKTTLFQGYVKESRYTRKGHSGQDYPHFMMGNHSVTCQGEALRLIEALAPQRYAWFDQAAQAPSLVDTVISELLGGAGYAASEIDVPGSSMRLWGADDANYMTDVATPVFDVVMGHVRNFYGGQFIYDANAGAAGMWRVLPQKQAPYNYLARFEVEEPDDVKTRLTGPHSSKFLPHVSEAYGTSSETSPLGNTQTVVHTFIQRKTLMWWYEKPEGNLVYVCGMSGIAGCGDEQTKTPRLFDRVLVNVASYNAFNVGPMDDGFPDVTHPDYIGHVVPIHYYDPRLPSQEAVDFVARRIFDYACHGRTHLQFTAPLILVTDEDDSQQSAPRMLRHYDVVQVFNQETGLYDDYLVDSVTPAYRQDRAHMAVYHLVRSSIMDSKAVGNSLLGRAIYINGKLQGRSVGRALWDPFAGWYAKFQEVMGNMTEIIQLPNPHVEEVSGGDPVQDLDPSSPTYGDFAWMEGIDSIA